MNIARKTLDLPVFLWYNIGMASVRKTRYSVYNINYHFVWIPKYRAKVLVDNVKNHLVQVLEKTATENEVEILHLDIQPDYVHLSVSAPPRHSPAWLINTFKGVTSRRLREKFPHLRQVHPKSLWTRTYYVGTTEHLSAEVIQSYIEEAQDE